MIQAFIHFLYNYYNRFSKNVNIDKSHVLTFLRVRLIVLFAHFTINDLAWAEPLTANVISCMKLMQKNVMVFEEDVSVYLAPDIINENIKNILMAKHSLKSKLRTSFDCNILFNFG